MSETNNGMMALADLAAQNENLKPLIDAIEAIMNSGEDDAYETIKPCLNDDDDEVKKNAEG